MQMQLLYAHLRARVFARSVCTRIANFFKHPMQEVAIVTLQEQENVDRYRVSRECFVAVMVARTLPFLTTLDEVQRDIDAAQASYRARVWEHGGESRKDLRARLSSLQTELQHAKAAIGHWPLARRGDLGSWFGSEFDAMQRVPQVEACRATDTSLLVVTQPLFGYNKSAATWHPTPEDAGDNPCAQLLTIGSVADITIGFSMQQLIRWMAPHNADGVRKGGTFESFSNYVAFSHFDEHEGQPIGLQVVTESW